MDNLSPDLRWLAQPGERLRQQDGAVRLSLSAADEGFGELAWTAVADLLLRHALPGDRLEVEVPEQSEGLLDRAIAALCARRLRLMQLTLEPGPPRFVVCFQPATLPARQPEFFLCRESDGRTWPLFQDSACVLGRDEGCAVPLESPLASGQHCAIHFARRAYALIDLGSRAGTFLANVPLRRGVIEDFGLVCLGRKDTGRYLEMELTLSPGEVAYLHVISGDAAGQSFPLHDPCVTVGRSSRCEVRIDAPYVSREHLRLLALADSFLLTDLGSTNGTVVNERPVLGVRLVPGDCIRVGEECFRFQNQTSRQGFYQKGWRARAGTVELRLDRPLTSIGREPSCELCLTAPAVSRHHARLVWEPPGQLRLYDLGSGAGTAVNGRVVADAWLHGGETLRLGSATVSIVGPEEQACPC